MFAQKAQPQKTPLGASLEDTDFFRHVNQCLNGINEI